MKQAIISTKSKKQPNKVEKKTNPAPNKPKPTKKDAPKIPPPSVSAPETAPPENTTNNSPRKRTLNRPNQEVSGTRIAAQFQPPSPSPSDNQFVLRTETICACRSCREYSKERSATKVGKGISAAIIR